MIARPQENEYHAYFSTYINKVDENGFMAALKDLQMRDLISGLSDSQWSHSYAPGKWTIKEALLHLMDTERIFCYRALRIARNDKTALSGFEQDDYVPKSNAHRRSKESIIEEYKAVRKSTIALFSNIDRQTLSLKGTASNSEMSVAALGFHISGHQKHHRNVIRERYL